MAGNKQSTISKLLASAGLSSSHAEHEPATGANSDPADRPEDPPAATVAESDAQAAVAAARDQATTDERARWNAVLTSPEGKANTPNAVFLLNTTGASSEQIIGHLKDSPAAPKAPEKTAGDKAAETGAERQPTARIPVGDQAAGARTAHQEGDGQGEDDKVDAKAFWGETIGKGGQAMETAARVAADRSASATLGAGARLGA
jgi:hypothetical protein